MHYRGYNISWKVKAGCLSAVFVLFATALLAQPTLQAVVKHNVFFVQEKKGWSPYVEVYFDVDPRTVLFERTDDSFRAVIRTDIELKNEKGIVNSEKYLLETMPVAKGTNILSIRITDLRRLSAAVGKTTITVKLTDQQNKEHPYILQEEFDINPSNELPFISDIQLVDTTVATTMESIYQRNNHLQFPLASDFLEERKFLNYYSEIYLPDSFPTKEKLVLKTFVSKKELTESVYQLQKTDSVVRQSVSINEGRFDISVLPSGNYYLNMTIENKPYQVLANKTIFFQVLNKKPNEAKSVGDSSVKEEQEEVQYVNLGKTFTSKYKPEQIRAILKMLLPVATPIERNAISQFLRNSDDMYARYFIYNFWMSRDKNEPEKAWKEYAEKVKVVNHLFGLNSMPGYESDRGFIQLKYGEPDDRMQVNNEEYAQPYEIWQYNSLPKNGNALFLFYKPGNTLGNYELLHSTVVGEKRNLQWRSYLYVNGVNNNNLSSKAEFYFGNR